MTFATRRSSLRALLFSLLLYFIASSLPLSTSAQVATGTPPFGSFSGGPDIINNANLNVHWTIPVLHKPGRGTNFIYDLSYDSSVWYPVTSGSTTTWMPVANWGWGGQTQVALGYVTYSVVLPEPCGSGTITYYAGWAYHDPLGAVHNYSFTIVDPGNSGCSGQTSASAVATDGSGYTLKASVSCSKVNCGTTLFQTSLILSNGQVRNTPLQTGTGSGTSTDRNGNQITVDSSGHFYDTLSSTTPVLTVAGSGTPTSSITFTYTAPSGTSAHYTMSYVAYTVATNFAVSGINEYGATAVNLVDKITLPDNTFYQFTYEQTPSTPSTGACTPKSGTYQNYCVTARIHQVTLPTGGSITYAYSGGAGTNGSGIFSDGSAATLTRTLTPGGAWTYAQVKNTGASSTTTITDPTTPTANQTVIQFQGIYETQRQVYQGSSTSGTLLATTNTCYNGSTSPCNSTAITLPITQRAVITAIPSSGSSTLQSKSVATYNSFGVPTEFDAYAFGSGGVGGLIKKTLITYASLQNITAFQQTVTVQNGAGTVLAQTNYNYDETTPVAAPTGTTQLVSVSGSRGNLTSVQNCTVLSSCSSYLKSTMTYDTAGQLQTAKDPAGNTTSFDYTDNYFIDNGANPPQAQAPSATTDALAKTVTLPIIGAMTNGYYLYSGQRASSTDQNGNNSFSHFQDLFARLTSAYGPVAPNGNRPWTLNVYAGSHTQADTYLGITDATAQQSCTSCRHDQVLLDGLGRAATQELVSDPEGATSATTSYDPVGRVKNVSHPYRTTSDSTYGFETPAYDALGRIIKVTHQDNTYSQTSFGAAVSGTGVNTAQLCSTTTYGLGYPTLIVDEAGKKREIWTDGLGRTIEGDEPDSSGNLTSFTCYNYDPLGNLLQIVHGTQTRSYVYDPLSRITSVTIPERANSSGTNCAVTYSYDSNSNLKTRTVPAPNQTTCTTTVTTTYSYDALNRLTGKTYSDSSPAVQYGYDGTALIGCSTTPPTLTDSNPKGRRTSMCDSSGATSWVHDAVGRILTEKRIILGVTQTISYAYNLDGSIATITYPSSKVVTYTTSNARRLTAAKDVANSIQFATAASYVPPGGLSGVITGQISGGFGGITESHTFNSSLEYTSTKATSTAGTAMDLSLSYNLSGGDNGTVTGITNSADSGRTQSFVYDPLNRILSAQSSATSGADCWGQNFGPDGLAADDALANLTKINSGTQTAPPCPFGSLSATVDANNHITTDSTYAYDAAGNMTKDGTGSSYSYTFDDENNLILAGGFSGGPYCYVYDGNGLRVAKKSGATTCSSGTVTKLYWRSVAGDSLAETDSTGSTTNAAYNEYVFFAGRRIASRNGTGGIFYFFADQVGSTRTITTGSGSGQTPGQLCYDADFSPYGQEISHMERLQTTACPPNYKFTGYEHDSETGLDYAFARYYSSRLGRFLSTDPLGGSIGDLQSHNAYTYVANNPLNLIDPLGLRPQDPNQLAPFYKVCAQAQCGGNGGTCTLDGIDTSCDLAIALLQSGAANLCADPTCIGGLTPPGTVALPGGGVAVIQGECVSLRFVISGASTTPTCTLTGVTIWPGLSDPSGSSSGSSTLDNRANALAHAINKTGVQSVFNPPIKQWAKSYFCGKNPANNVLHYAEQGATKGAITGAIAGFPEGGPIGSFVMGGAGAGIGTFVGLISGSAASIVCSLGGAYGPAPYVGSPF